jgi:DNA-binding transcriptional ArsR family regulator
MLAEIFSSNSRADIFRILFDGDKKEIYLREIHRLSGKSIRSIQQEVQHLLSLDLIEARKDGNRIYYKANTEHPIYIDLVSIVEKTIGIISLLKASLTDPKIACAFIFGSMAKNKEKAASDIDLIIVVGIARKAGQGNQSSHLYKRRI